MYTHFFVTAALAILPSVQAAPNKRGIPSGNWIELDCYVADVQVNGKSVDKDKSLKYDWQLTQQTCVNNYKGLANYDNGKGRCVSISPDGLSGSNWWHNCVKQADNGWYDVDSITGNVVISHAAYTSKKAEGRGYAFVNS